MIRRRGRIGASGADVHGGISRAAGNGGCDEWGVSGGAEGACHGSWFRECGKEVQWFVDHAAAESSDEPIPPHVCPGWTYFFTVKLARRGGDLLVRHIDMLREAVRVTRTERPFEIDAIVVMPDHLHTVWTLPKGDADFSTRWRLIKTRFSRGLPRGDMRASHHRRQERAIWQRRFWEHCIRDEADFSAHMRYCLFNPVKHGYVTRPEDWPWSSIHRDR